MRQKYQFHAWASMSERTVEIAFVTHPLWAESTARKLVYDWIDDQDEIDGNITWGYYPQVNR